MKRQNSPENLEKVQDLKLGGDPAAAGEATEVGFGLLHCLRSVSLTPNSETPRLLWLG